MSQAKTYCCVLAAIVLTIRFSSVLPAQDSEPVRVDLLIKGGRVMDGTGNPWQRADVAVRDGRIVLVGSSQPVTATKTIDAGDLVVAPGFIDLHSHAAAGLESADGNRRQAANLLTQGITTVVLNPDGVGGFPLDQQRTRIVKHSIGLNAILMAGHNTIRRKVMAANYRRAANREEIAEMARLVRQALRQGAFGLTAGLEYVPGIWSTPEELKALVKELVPFRAPFLVHERSSGKDPFWYFPSQHSPNQPTMVDNIRELIGIAEETGGTVVATHIKARGMNFWGSSRIMVDMIQTARRRGVSFYADQYPYRSSGSDGRLILIPPWARTYLQRKYPDLPEPEQLKRGMRASTFVKMVRQDVAHIIRRRGGAQNITVMDFPRKSFVGKSLHTLAKEAQVSPIDMALKLQLEGNPQISGGVRIRAFSMAEKDVAEFAQQPWTATATDAGIALAKDGPVHARFYGTFPRKIYRYAIQQKLMTVEQAIRSSTSLPAQILSLQDRGLIRTGQVADLVLLDLAKLRDRATYEKPHQISEGVEYVLLAGKIAVAKGRPTGNLLGKVLLPTHYRPAKDAR